MQELLREGSAEANMELAVAQPGRGDAPGNVEPGPETSLVIEKLGPGGHSVRALWNIAGFGSSNKQKMLYSKYFEVGGYDCRLLVYPTGDAQALPGYMSVYLQISDPGSSSSKWDCFASYRLAVRNMVDDSKSVRRDSWHRFSAKKRSHGWCDFAALASVLDGKQGFLRPGDVVQVSTDITILNESVAFSRESDLGGGAPPTSGEVYSGKFVWKVQNFSAFQALLRTQKIMSPAFPAGECALRMSVYQSTVGGAEYLSVCLESKDTDRGTAPERTCWCLFRLAVLPQGEGEGRAVHRDSYGRFAADSRGGDNTSLGWNDFMRMEDFAADGGAYLVGDTAVFSTSFHVIRENTSLVRHLEPRAGTAGSTALLTRGRDKRKAAQRESDCAGRFTWRVENFTRLKDLLKKRKITGLCIKSRRFTVGGRDCRLIVYPRGQSQPPTFLSLFLEVTDPRAASPDWTCFVSHRLSVVNQRGEADRSVAKESQNRYSKSAKDWGWREFVSLTTLFDADAGFLVDDAVVFSAEVLVLKEGADVRSVGLPAPVPPALKAAPAAGDGAAADDNGGAAGPVAVDPPPGRTSFTWRIENFLAFKDVVETRKIFSRFFPAGPCDLRIGLYESFDSLCVYLESDASVAPPPIATAPGGNGAAPPPAPERPANYWVRYRAAVLNQRYPDRTQWKEGTMLTRSWNNSVLQFPRLPAGSSAEQEVGLVLRDSLALGCEVLEWRLWTEADAEAAGPQGGAMGTGRVDDARSLGGAAAGRLRLAASDDSDAEDSDVGDPDSEEDFGTVTDAEAAEAEVEDALGQWLSSAGLELLGIDNHPPLLGDASSVQRALESTLLRQPGSIPMFVASLRMYMSSLPRVRRLLLPCLTTTPATPDSVYGIAPAVMSILMGLPALRQPLMAMLVDVMLDHCLTARMHMHRQQQQQRQDQEQQGQQQPAAAAPPASPDAADLDGGDPVEALSVDSSTEVANGVVVVVAAAEGGASDSEDATCVPSASPLPSPERPHQQSTRISGTLADETPSDVEQVVGLVLGWMLSLDPALMQPLPTKSGNGNNGRLNAPLSSLQKVSMLLADAPRPLQPDIVALVPKLVDPSEHTAAAGALLGRLAEASREGFEAEAELRLPVLAALGTLQIDPAVAEKVLNAALEALPNLSDGELPPAVGLVLKLASSTETARAAAVHAVRERVRGANSPSPPPGALDALRLAVVQHTEVAASILAAISAECKAARAACGEPAADGCAADATPPLHRSDLEVLLDCLALPALQGDAVHALEKCVTVGMVTEASLLPLVSDRRAAARGSERARDQASSAAGAAPVDGDAAIPASRGPLVLAGVPLASAAQRAFVAAHPLAHPSTDGVMPAILANQLRLHFPANVPPAGLPALPAPPSVDELGGLLAAAEGLLHIKRPCHKTLAAGLYHTLFCQYDDPTSRQRVLHSLAQRSIANGSPLEQMANSAKEAADPPAAAQSEASTPRGASADLAAAPASAPAPPSQLLRVGELAAAPVIAAEVLAFLVEAVPGSSRLALAVALDIAAAAQVAAQQAGEAASDAEGRHAQALAAAQVVTAAKEGDLAAAQQRCSELEGTVARMRAEHAVELATVESARKDQQASVRALEQQVEWVRDERNEERAARARDAKESAQRLSEAEAQLARLKAARRDEQKRQQKERGTAVDRARELEENMGRADAEVARLRAEAALVTSRADKATTEARRRMEAAEQALAERDAELAATRAATGEREAQLRSALEARRDLDQRLTAAQAQLAALTSGAGLEAAVTGELESVARLHDHGLKRTNALLLQRGRPAVGVPPSPAPSAVASPLGKAAFRPQLAPTHQRHQQQPAAGMSGVLPQGLPALGHGLTGSLDSLQSMPSLSSAPSVGLFAGAGWGLPTSSALSSQGAATPMDSSAGAVDAASMEKLLGLLPSDLLHS